MQTLPVREMDQKAGFPLENDELSRKNGSLNKMFLTELSLSDGSFDEGSANMSGSSRWHLRISRARADSCFKSRIL